MPGPVNVVPLAGQVWEAVAFGQALGDNQNIVNRVRYILSSGDGVNPVAPGAIPAFLNLFSAKWTASMLAVLTTNYGLLRTEAKCVTNVVPDPHNMARADIVFGGNQQLVESPPKSGARALPANPAFVTASFRFFALNVSRFSRGGMRVSPTADADLNGVSWVPAYYALLQGAAEALIAPLPDVASNSVWTPCTFSAKLAMGQPSGVGYINYKNYAFPWVGSQVNQYARSEIHRKLKSFLN